MNDNAKTEMAHISNEQQPETKKAQAIAMLRFSRGMVVNRNHVMAKCQFDNHDAAEWLEKTLREIYGHDPVTVTIKMNTPRGIVDRYEVRVVKTGGTLALQTGLFDRRSKTFIKGIPIDVAKTKNFNQLKAVWRGAFLAAGHLDEPGENAKLTIVGPTMEAARALQTSAERLGIKSQIVERTNMRGVQNFYVVITEADTIERILKLMGAVHTSVEWSGKRTDGEKKTATNRLANFDDANLRRSVKAAEEASTKIEHAFEVLGDDIPPKLREAGQLRLDNRESSLEQLGQMANPPLSKDAIAGRIRRLLQLADRKVKQDEAAEGASKNETVVKETVIAEVRVVPVAPTSTSSQMTPAPSVPVAE